MPPSVLSVARVTGPRPNHTGDEILTVNGEHSDVITKSMSTAPRSTSKRRGGLEQQLVVHKAEGAARVELAHAIFDRVQTCDNHCPFCFIHQLPKGMRRSLYLQDDDFDLVSLRKLHNPAALHRSRFRTGHH
jgi:NifB/MoaA-like Fe-S oxidoreductase